MRNVCMCDFCRYTGSEAEVIEHEKTCLSNPKVKCCQNCKYAFRTFCAIDDTDDVNPSYSYVCKYRDILLKRDTLNLKRDTLNAVFHFGGDTLPDENICEHYERGLPA